MTTLRGATYAGSSLYVINPNSHFGTGNFCLALLDMTSVPDDVWAKYVGNSILGTLLVQYLGARQVTQCEDRLFIVSFPVGPEGVEDEHAFARAKVKKLAQAQAAMEKLMNATPTFHIEALRRSDTLRTGRGLVILETEMQPDACEIAI